MSVFTGSKRNVRAAQPAEILDASCIEHIVELVGLGALVSIGTTRDGGTCVLSVLFAGESNRDYPRDAVAASDFLHECTQDILAASDRSPAPTGRLVSRKARTTA